MRFVLTCSLVFASNAFAQESETIEVKLDLLTGGSVTGLVVEATDHGIVVVAQSTPLVFAWSEVEAGSAYAAKARWLALLRGGREKLTAQDHYRLGLFALDRERSDLANIQFREAIESDNAYSKRARTALDEYRIRRKEARERGSPFFSASTNNKDLESVAVESTEGHTPETFLGIEGVSPVGTSAQIQAQAMAIYNTFGQRVRDAIAKDLALVETDHFLIWTDWEKLSHPRLEELCESMYAALCAQFGFDSSKTVFLAKCPVFCWRNKARFRKFARLFDGYDGTESIGYSRSIEKNGHVHLALVRLGRSWEDYHRFACTLVHEGTHAFLHRFHSTRLLPHWINEGYAELMAHRVLGDRCPSAKNAALLARQYVRFDWPVSELLHSTGPIAVQQYPLAHSIVAYLESAGPGRAGSFIISLKEGLTVAEALAANYDRMTLDELESRWRESVRRRIAGSTPQSPED